MEGIKNIIFDFGGVIIDIGYERIAAAFRSYGMDDFDGIYTQMRQADLFDDFEKGLITPDEFRRGLRKASGLTLTDEEIDLAWNAILIGLPKENIELLQRLKLKYRLFLLSNTNAIHEKAFNEIIHRDFGGNILEKVFEKIYFSHHLKMRKPDSEVFLHVLKENGLKAEETLFVDDSYQHIEGAAAVGIRTLFVEKEKKISEYFKEK